MNEKALKWACRRGMLELDILLNQFLSEGYAHLSEPQKLTFVELLKTEDAELFAWLMGKVEPCDENLLKMIGLVRQNVVKLR